MIKLKSILFISHSSGLSGAERSLLSLLKHLDRNRFDPYVVVPCEGPMCEVLNNLNIEYQPLCIPWWFRPEEALQREAVLGPSITIDACKMSSLEASRMAREQFWKRMGELEKIITQRGIEIVHTNTVTMLEGVLAAYRTRVKHVWHLREFIEGHPSHNTLLPKSFYRWFIRKFSDHVIVASHAMVRAYEAYVHAGRLHKVSNGIELDSEILKNSKSDLRTKYINEFGLNSELKLVATIGYSRSVKGWMDVVETAKRVKEKGCNNVIYLIVGPTETDPDYFGEVKAKTDQYGLSSRIIYTGYRSDVQSLMAASDVVFQPSLMESFSRVAVEAMAAGVPVLGTRCGGMEEVVRHNETGYLVGVGDQDAMADSLIDLLCDPDKRQRFGEEGRRVYLENFTIERYVEAVMNIYERVLKEEKRQPFGDGMEIQAFAEMYASILGLMTHGEQNRGYLNWVRKELETIRTTRSFRYTAFLRRMWSFLKR